MQRHPSGIPAPAVSNRSPQPGSVPPKSKGNTISQYFQPKVRACHHCHVRIIRRQPSVLLRSSPFIPQAPSGAQERGPLLGGSPGLRQGEMTPTPQQGTIPPAQESRGARSPAPEPRTELQEKLQQVSNAATSPTFCVPPPSRFLVRLYLRLSQHGHTPCFALAGAGPLHRVGTRPRRCPRCVSALCCSFHQSPLCSLPPLTTRNRPLHRGSQEVTSGGASLSP